MRLLAVLWLGGLAVTASAQIAQQYRARFLPEIYRRIPTPLLILSNNDVVTGAYDGAEFRTLIFDRSTYQTVSVPSPYTAVGEPVVARNDLMSGYFQTGSPIFPKQHAYRWDANNGFQIIPFVHSGANWSIVYDVNSSGTIVALEANYDTGSGIDWVIYNPDGSAISQYGYGARQVNDAGRLLAYGTQGSAWYKDPGGDWTRLPQLQPGGVDAESLNEAGYMTTQIWTGLHPRLQLHDPTGNVIMNRFVGSSEHFLNNHNVLLYNDHNGPWTNRAWLWSESTGHIRLSDRLDMSALPVGTELSDPTFFNDRGQMIFLTRNLITNEYCTALVEPVPEPATFAALALGLVPLLRKRRC